MHSNGRITLTDQARIVFKGILDPIAAFLNRIGLSPNTITFIGLLGNTAGAVFLAFGKITIGGLIILVMAPLDALDGSMARLRGENRRDSSAPFGAFLDSTIDRYSEMITFAGLLIYFALQDNWLATLLTYLAACGSLLVSYTRARAQAQGVDTKIGLLTRFERYLVLIPSLVFNIPVIGMCILAIFTNITAVQRIIDVWRKLNIEKQN